MRHALQIYLRLIGVHLRSQLQYRLSFSLDALGTGFFTLISFITLAAVFTRFGGIGGWSLGEVAFLFGLVEVSFATMDMIFSGFDPDFFSQQVRRGSLDQMLLRPLNLALQVFSSELVLRRVGRIAQGLAVFGLGAALADVSWTWPKIVYLPVVFASTVMFFGSLFVIGATICFWTVQSIEAINILTYGGSEMLSYPVHIYHDWLRRFFTFIIPGALVVYYPSLYFLDRPDPLGLPPAAALLAPLAGAGMLSLAFGFWRLGVRKYTSTGT